MSAENSNSFFQNIIDMSKTLQVKMREYSDAVTGKMNPNNVSIEKVHATLITKIKSDPAKYKTLVLLANNYTKIDIDQQPFILEEVYKLVK